MFSIVKGKSCIMRLKIAILFVAGMTVAGLAYSQQGQRVIAGKKCTLYKVIPKDTWTGLSHKYKMSIDELKSVNQGVNDLKIGQIINIPIEKSNDAGDDIKQSDSPVAPTKQNEKSSESSIHIIEKGETLFGIARKFNVTADQIRKWNHLENDGIKAGQKLIVAEKTKPVIEKTVATPSQKEATVQTIDDKKLEQKNEQVRNDSKLIAEANNKMIPATPSPNEMEYKASRTETKKVSGKSGTVIEVNETGMASWIHDNDINQSKFYALHRTAAPGTIIKVTNRMNGDYVFVKVVGQLHDTGDNDKQIIKMSEAAAKRIGALNEKFQVELNYGITN